LIIPDLPNCSKVEGFADDITAILKASVANIQILNDILNDFGAISGLKVNNDKTKILTISNDNNLKHLINNIATELGYKVVNNLDLLGFKVYADSKDLVKNWDNVVSAIEKKINLWKIFNLSIQGRIVVAKTHLISQVQFYGTVLIIPKETESTISNLIENFVQGGGKKLARTKLYAPINEGGINLISIRAYCEALKCGLIKHSRYSCDWWARVLRLKCCHDENWDNIDPEGLTTINTPLILGIARAWKKATITFF